jgi:hypothetical protein
VIGDVRTVNERLACGRATTDDVRGGHGRGHAVPVVAAEHVDVLDRTHRAHGLGVRLRLGTATEHEQTPRLLRGEVADGERGDRRRP